MANENLTRTEAFERAQRLVVQSYDVDLDLTVSETTFESTTTVKFTCSEPGWSTFIDLLAPRVLSASLNGVALDVGSFDGARLPLPELAASNELVVRAECVFMNTGEGLHRFVDPVDDEVYLYSQFEVADARRVYACFDQPDVKSEFQFQVTAPDHWTVVSNTATPAPTPAGPGAATWSFARCEKMSPYITAIIAGPYHQVSDELVSSDGRVIPLKLLCRPSLAKHLEADEIFELTKKGFAYFEEKFQQPYPFSKYDQVFVPEFNAGAMENAGAVTFRDQYIFRSKVSEAVRERRALTILHELAHMWFGNLVTMHWWDDLWLNESFAEWASTQAMTDATEYTSAWTTFAVHEKGWAYRQDQLPSTHPIVADMVDLAAVDANFDGITYAKGAATLKQLVHYVGEEAFDAALVEYFKKHAWGNTRLPDLHHELQTASGRDLSDWSARWLEKAGVPTLTPELTTDDSGVLTSVVIHQTAPQEYPTLRPHRLVVGCYNLNGDQLVRTHRVELDVDGPVTSVDDLVGVPRPDLLLVNDEDQTYCKIRLDAQSLACAVQHMSKLTDPLARVLVWSAAWDMTRDGQYRGRDCLALIAGSIGAETNAAARSTILGHVSALCRFMVHPSHRGVASEQMADSLWQLAQVAPAGSDAQLLLTQTFIGLACTPAHAQALADVLSGAQELPGLTVDVDLRWQIVVALSGLGHHTEADVDAVLADDPTSAGALMAATAKAAFPTPEAKAAAWQELMTNDGLANDTQAAIIRGFTMAKDPELLAPYVAPYFECQEGIWARRTSEMATQITSMLYPVWLASAELLAQTEQYLAQHPQIVSAHRRILLEQSDSAARYLRCQEADGAQ